MASEEQKINSMSTETATQQSQNAASNPASQMYSSQPEISGNNFNMQSLYVYINSLHNQLQIMSKTINNLQKQRDNDIQTIYQSMTAQIQMLNNTMRQNQQKNHQIINNLKQKIRTLTKQQQIQTKQQQMQTKNNNKQKEEKNNDVDTKNEVYIWLNNTCKLAQYSSSFIQNGYNNMSIVSKLTDNDLQQIGIDKIGHRRKIYQQIQSLNPKSKNTKPKANTNTNESNVNQTEHVPEKENTAKKKAYKYQYSGPKWEKVKKTANMFEESKSSKPSKSATRKINWGKNKKPRHSNKLFQELPIPIQNGCETAQIEALNELQSKIMNSLYCSNVDNMIISPAGSGKTVAIILSSIYRLSQMDSTAPTHIVFIAIDHIHVTVIKSLCEIISEYYEDITVIEQVRGSRYFNPNTKDTRKNIWICSPGKGVNIFEMGGKQMIRNTICINIFDSDKCLVEPLFTKKIQNMFQYIPNSAAIDINIISNSLCAEMAMNIQVLLGNERYAQLQKHIYNNYNNLQFWSVFCNRNNRVNKLQQLLDGNICGQGLIFFTGPHQAKKVCQNIGEKYKCVLFESKALSEAQEIIQSYNNGNIKYLFIHTYSPFCLLQNIEMNRLRFMIHFDIKQSSHFLTQCTVGKYNQDVSIECVSLIDEYQTKIYQDIERNCSIKFEQLPSKIDGVFGANEKEIIAKNIDEKQNEYGVENKQEENKNECENKNTTNAQKLNENNEIVIENNSFNMQQIYGNYNNENINYESEQINMNMNMNMNMNQMFSNEGVQNNNNNLQPQAQPQPQPQPQPIVKKDMKGQLMERIDKYMISGNLNEILNLNCCDFKIWACIINEMFRDRNNDTEIGYFIDLILNLFRNHIFNNNDDRFHDQVVKYLSIQMDISLKKNIRFIDYTGYFFANLCYNKYLIPNQCYSFFIKRYKEYSDEDKNGQKININKLINASVHELQQLKAPQKLIHKINKLAIK